MCDGLCVGGDSVVFLAAEVDIFGAEGGEGVRNGAETFIGGSMLNENLSMLISSS